MVLMFKKIAGDCTILQNFGDLSKIILTCELVYFYPPPPPPPPNYALIPTNKSLKLAILYVIYLTEKYATTNDITHVKF